MTNLDDQLKLQAFLDGELPEDEAKVVSRRIANDQDASLLLKELRLTKQILARQELNRQLPETREFFWSKVEREISRLEPATVGTRAPILPWWKRWLMPAITAACMALALFIGIRQFSSPTISPNLVETALTDNGAFTYRDEVAGVTLVWLSYPADSGIAETGPDVIVQ